MLDYTIINQDLDHSYSLGSQTESPEKPVGSIENPESNKSSTSNARYQNDITQFGNKSYEESQNPKMGRFTRNLYSLVYGNVRQGSSGKKTDATRSKHRSFANLNLSNSHLQFSQKKKIDHIKANKVIVSTKINSKFSSENTNKILIEDKRRKHTNNLNFEPKKHVKNLTGNYQRPTESFRARISHLNQPLSFNKGVNIQINNHFKSPSLNIRAPSMKSDSKLSQGSFKDGWFDSSMKRSKSDRLLQRIQSAK